MGGVILVVVIAIIAGLILSVASVLFNVPVDEKEAAIRECLPGANCGACGYSGCDGYARALADGSAENGLCSPGGQETATKIAALIGGSAEVEKKTAVVMCQGDLEHTTIVNEYNGLPSCRAASLSYGGNKACAFGCLGFGDCEKVCPENAICIVGGVAKVNSEACIACGKCAAECPKHIIKVVPEKFAQHVKCRNTDKGPAARKVCKTACIGCMKCQKGCPADAIHVKNNLAEIDYEKCVNCGKCKNECPTGAIL
ncbi:MAG: RnfABCDGE type electron transport complex subunit B [Lachnospiraceae bacterium]|nr:RnfABCDGE type electron transport complex subunit B [Lachnospiraceae bacterium]